MPRPDRPAKASPSNPTPRHRVVVVENSSTAGGRWRAIAVDIVLDMHVEVGDMRDCRIPPGPCKGALCRGHLRIVTFVTPSSFATSIRTKLLERTDTAEAALSGILRIGQHDRLRGSLHHPPRELRLLDRRGGDAVLEVDAVHPKRPLSRCSRRAPGPPRCPRRTATSLCTAPPSCTTSTFSPAKQHAQPQERRDDIQVMPRPQADLLGEGVDGRTRRHDH